MADTAVLSSAVRLPTPPPGASYEPGPSASKKRSPPSRSPSPRRRRSPPGHDRQRPNGDPVSAADREPDERERMLQARFKPQESKEVRRKPMTEEEKQAAAKAEYEKLLSMRSGGTYIPPARLRALQAQITDKTSKEYQRMAWEALKKSINGLINKINVSNIKHIVPELFNENLVRGKGLFCRSIMKAQSVSLPFTPIYAAMAAIVNTKLPQVGELLIHRLVVQFRKAFKRNDKAVCTSATTFLAHLCNQQVVSDTVVAQMLLLLLQKPSDDSVEIAVALTREVGQHLEEMNPAIALLVFDEFRKILHEADIDKRVQYMIEVLFQVRKDKYKDNPAIKEELDLVEEEDQIVHNVDLDDDIKVEDTLNIFKFDPEWEENEEKYRKLKSQILGEGSDDEDDGDESGSDESSTDEGEDEAEKQMEIKDQTNTNLVNLRKTIYLTMKSSLDFEEAAHKLMRVQIPAGYEHELPSMIVECCSQEKTFSKFYGSLGERFAKINRTWLDLFETCFAKYYDTIHRYETNRLRNIAQFFGHLLSTDAIGWHVLSVVHLNEEETTSSSRIFIKILFQELASAMGLPKLQERFKDDILRPSFEGLFPTDNPRNTRFSINYFTSIGMGSLTEEMREHLRNLPKPAPPPLPVVRERSASVSSYSSYTSSYSSYSSRSDSRSRSPPRRRVTDADHNARRGRSITRSESRSPSRRGRGASSGSSASGSLPRRTARRRSVSYSASPPPRPNDATRGRPRGRSLSYTPSPSQSPAPRRRGPRKRSFSSSRSPAARNDRRSNSLSRSPQPQRRRRGPDSASRSPPRGTDKRDSRRSTSPPPRRFNPRRNSSSDGGASGSSPPRRRRSPKHEKSDRDARHEGQNGRGRARASDFL